MAKTLRQLPLFFFFGALLGMAAPSWAQNTPTETRTLTFTRTATSTKTQTGTPTETFTATQSFTPTVTSTPTVSWTPNLTLTPPCSPSGFFGNNSGGGGAGTSNTLRASLYHLSAPATVLALWVYSANPGVQYAAALYGGSAGNLGSLIVQSTVQTTVSGWNGFSIPATLLAGGNYWLAYMCNSSSYTDVTANTGSNNLAYTKTILTFGAFPTNVSGISYGNGEVAIYGVFCAAPTSTPTASFTPTQTFTPTITATATQTGTIFTGTPTLTNTPTPSPTLTVTPTSTFSATPNLSFTPDCGASAAIFGDTDTSGAPATATAPEMRACRYTLPVDGTVETISLYADPADAGVVANVGLYTSISSGGASQMGNFVTESSTAQTLTGGWNVFKVPNAPVTAGDYWLAYIFNSSNFVIHSQNSAPGANTLAYTNTLPNGFNFDATGAAYSPSYGTSVIYDPIYASYCPGLIDTSTPTDSPTVTPTFTVTNSPTVTGTPTITQTPTDTFTPAWTGTSTNSPTETWTGTSTPSPTITDTPTDSSSPTPSFTPTVTFTFSLTGTNSTTATPSPTLTATPSETPTDFSTSTWTPTWSPTPTFTSAMTDTFSPTPTFTNSPTATPPETLTDTPTYTWSPTPTPTSTQTPSPTLSSTPTDTPIFTATPTGTDSGTATPSPTASRTPTATSVIPLESPLLYPNPFKGSQAPQIDVNFGKPHDYVRIRVFTTAFRKIFEDNLRFVPAGPFSYALDPSRWANGLYYVVLSTPSNQWVLKLIIAGN